ncbi:MAG: RNA polymerase sigma factor [Sandaracinaceae bacterium]
MSRLRRRERDAFDAVYDTYQPRLYGFLLRLSGDRARAEDLVQETFVRLAHSAPSLRPDTRLSAWLFRVARNLWFDQRRRALLDLDRLRELSLWPRARLSPTTPFTHLVADQTQARLERALALLPTPQREAILLVAVEGFSPHDAARIADVKPAALRQRLRRARAALRVAMETM